MREERQTLGLVQLLCRNARIQPCSGPVVTLPRGLSWGLSTSHCPTGFEHRAERYQELPASCLLQVSNSPAPAEPDAELGWGKTQAGATSCLLQSFPAKTHPGTVTGTRDSTGTERDFLLTKGEGGKSSVPVQISQCLLLPKVCPLCCGLFGG